jgi:hypothetical protein
LTLPGNGGDLGLLIQELDHTYARKNSPRENSTHGEDYNNLKLIVSNDKNLIRASKIELLVADAINHPSMINEKVEAY